MPFGRSAPHGVVRQLLLADVLVVSLTRVDAVIEIVERHQERSQQSSSTGLGRPCAQVGLPPDAASTCRLLRDHPGVG